jgi:hypothetical protein
MDASVGQIMEVVIRGVVGTAMVVGLAGVAGAFGHVAGGVRARRQSRWRRRGGGRRGGCPDRCSDRHPPARVSTKPAMT